MHVQAEKKRLVEELDELKDIKGVNPTTAGAGGGGALNSAGSAVKAFFRQSSNQDGGKDQVGTQRDSAWKHRRVCLKGGSVLGHTWQAHDKRISDGRWGVFCFSTV